MRRFGAAIALSVLSLATAVAFQNCNPRSSAIDTGTGVASSPVRIPSLGGEASGNGEGYRGKLSYINRDLCGTSLGVKTRIELAEDGLSAIKTRDNCADIAPVPLSLASLGLMPYNLDNLIHTNKTFDLESTSRTTALLCRGEEPYTWANGSVGGQPVRVAADIQIFHTASGSATQVKLGWFDTNGVLLGKWASVDFPVRRTEIDKFEMYQGGELFSVVLGGPRSGVNSLDLTINKGSPAPFNASMTLMSKDGIHFPNAFQATFASVVVNCYPQ